MTLTATTSHTVGPYYHIGLTWLNRENLRSNKPSASAWRSPGKSLMATAMWSTTRCSKSGRPTPPASTPPGRRAGQTAGPDFEGFGRVPVDAEGRFRFTTIKPGTVEGLKGTTQAPHLVVLVFARGLVKHLLTRIYFEGEPANVNDPLLECVPAERRATLLAKPDAAGVYQWNVILQGTEAETVFFDY
jgi:protocatechuate 3,4-dioxygenase alpha subunit